MPGWLEELDRRKTQFGGDAAARKRRLLAAGRRARLADAEDLATYHEALCFLRAFPDDPEIMRSAESELRAFIRRVRPVADELAGSGIAGTVYAYPFGLPMAAWLCDRFGDAVDIDWDAYDDRKDDPLATILAPVAGWVETAALDDELLSAREWFDRSRGRRRANGLRRLLDRLHKSDLSIDAQETLYNSLELQLTWNIGASLASRTLARMPEQKNFFHAGPLRGRTTDLRAEIRARMPRRRPLLRSRARAWIDLARCALSVRDRELYPLALANEAEVYEAAVGRGVRIVLFGMQPRRRLPIETDYAAFVVKNGIPIGYGVGALLFEQMEIAVNIFPTFRQGESSFVFEQFNRFFHHQFGCDVFLVERYQLGHENEEGLDAGSFWFYYKLGFRSVEPKVGKLAAAEAARIQARPGYRTPRKTLERLARSHVVLHLDDSTATAASGISLTKIGLAVSRLIEERFEGDRAAAEEVCAREIARELGAAGWRRWPVAERTAFVHLSPLIRLLPGLAVWPREEQRTLIAILRAKGSPAEATYARLVMRAPRLRRALERIGKR
jgi:hypothetical protein